jgi:hypothetical protein
LSYIKERKLKIFITLALLLATISTKAQKIERPRVIKFDKQFVAAEAFESAAVLDVDRDGNLDIISGSFWYKGPSFETRKFIGPAKRHAEYYDDFSTILLDVNRDSRSDFITGGWFGGTLFWRENPGKDGIWPEHVIAHCGNIETTRSWDIDKDGTPEIIPNTPGKPLVIYRLKDKPDAQGVLFDSIQIFEKHGHGLGFGDINGDGRGDLIIDKGWLESPSDPFTGKWQYHPDFSVEQASVPMLVTDVNGDGLADLIIGQGHDYGLNWFEQKVDRKKIRSWIKHEIDPYNSQFHVLEWADLDNDGKNEIITGKRYRAHDDNDPGAHDPVGLYYYKWTGEIFSKQVISHGAPGIGKGTGLFFQVVDINGDGFKDIVVAGKDGLCVFRSTKAVE